MMYKLFINYIKLKLLRIILNRIIAGRHTMRKNKKNIKTMDFLTYGLEFFSTYYLSTKRKVK